MKKIVLISTFCDTKEKQDILHENVLKIKSLGLDVMCISPIPIRDEIVKDCDFFFFTKENPLLVWPVRLFTFWRHFTIPNSKKLVLQRGLADYGWAGLYQVKKLSQIALTFDYDFFYHMIYDLDITTEIENEFLSQNVNIIYSRRDPHNADVIWETTLHLMVFDREMIKKIEQEITLPEYLRTSGVAEGEVLKWQNKFNLQSSKVLVQDKVYFWRDVDMFDYSPHKDFKLFLSKNHAMNILSNTEQAITENIRLLFYDFEDIGTLTLFTNNETFELTPKQLEIIELPINSQKVTDLRLTYKNMSYDLSKTYADIMINQIYYD